MFERAKVVKRFQFLGFYNRFLILSREVTV